MITLPPVRLAVRIAREIHLPITTVLELPGRELALWAAVFEEEAREDTAQDEPEDVDPRAVFGLIGGEVTSGNSK